MDFIVQILLFTAKVYVLHVIAIVTIILTIYSYHYPISNPLFFNISVLIYYI